MPKVKRYYCPICDTSYDDWSSAKDCLDECRGELWVREGIAYACEFCGEEFLAQEFLTQHELGCIPTHINDGCLACERRTSDGYTDPDCKRKYSDIPRVNCPGYQPARM